MVSFLRAAAVRNQQSQPERVAHAKKLTLDAVDGRRGGFPDELRAEVEQMTTRLDGDEHRLRRWLRGFYWLSLLPLAAAVVAMVWLYWEPLWMGVQWMAGLTGS